MDSIGRYRLTRRLGSGSFATVWLGHDDDLDVPVAVKVLADNWASNDDVRNRFLAEARLMRQIRDDRIVRVYDIGSLPDQRPYFVMDYADAGSLEELRKQRIDPRRALQLCAEAGRALHVLHTHDVIHRDVTPGNILLSTRKDGGVHVLLADLGVAKSMIDEVGQTMTAGTPAYMALEQATGVGVLDHRADVYSLAAVTYAMLTGRPPFPVRTLAELLARDPNEPPAPIAAQVGAPPSLDALLAASLSPQPGRRPPSATVYATALDEITTQMTGSGVTGPAVPARTDATVLRPSPTSLSGTYPSGLHQQGLPHSSPYSTGTHYPTQAPAAAVSPTPPSPPTHFTGSAPTARAAGSRGLPVWMLVMGAIVLFVAAMFFTILLR